MSFEPLMDVVVETFLFLEMSDDQTVDQDAAVAVMEQIAATLRRLEPVELESFVQYLDRRAAKATNATERELIANMASGLGLSE